MIVAVLFDILLTVDSAFRYYLQAQREGKTAVVPEHRLYSAMCGSFGIPIG